MIFLPVTSLATVETLANIGMAIDRLSVALVSALTDTVCLLFRSPLGPVYDRAGSLSPVYFMRRGAGVPSVGEWLPRVETRPSAVEQSATKSDIRPSAVAGR